MTTQEEEMAATEERRAMPPTVEKLVLSAENVAKMWLGEGGTARAGPNGNFPPTVFVKRGKEVAFHVIQDMDNRHAEIRKAIAAMPGADGFAFLYDGMTTVFSAAERCEACGGEKCDECLGTGNRVLKRRAGAIAVVAMKKGDLDVVLRYTPYTVTAGKVEFGEPVVVGTGVGDDPKATATHEYHDMFGKEKRH